MKFQYYWAQIVITVLFLGIFKVQANESLNRTGTLWQPFIEWSLPNDSWQGNPFDVAATVTFSHTDSGATHQTSMFFDGDDTWKFRFTATQTGKWTFLSTSDDPELDGRSGRIQIDKNPDALAHGFMQSLGGKWAWQGSAEAFVPQYVMGPHLLDFFDVEKQQIDEEKMTAEIDEFVVGHGFTGFHLAIAGQWFDVGNDYRGKTDPDPHAYRVLETLIRRIHARGGACHLWMWLSDQRRTGPNGILGQAMNAADRRNLSYLAARLGPLPGWSLGYGYDTENIRFLTPDDLDQWKAYLDESLGWDHFIGARVGFDESGPKGGPKPPLDVKRNAPVGDQYCSWLGGDYIGYTSYRPMYDRYVQTLQHRPEKPSLEEDRFRIRDSDKWKHKDYDAILTRRGLWHSAMAGGVGNIWGNLSQDKDSAASQSYDTGNVRIKQQIKTYATFFRDKHRFRSDFLRDNALIDGGRVWNSSEDDEGELAACLRGPESRHFVFYREACSSLTIDLTGMAHPQPTIAVDTTDNYKEIDLGRLSPGKHKWQAPHNADWVIAIGEFAP